MVGIPHDLKGQGIYAYVVLNPGFTGSDELRAELVKQIKIEISAIAKPDVIHFALDLPKTRSGKIMRRILRKIACKEVASSADFGDLSKKYMLPVLDGVVIQVWNLYRAYRLCSSLVPQLNQLLSKVINSSTPALFNDENACTETR